MLPLLASAAAGKVKKPQKIDPKKFAGQMEETKTEAKGGALVPQPKLSIIKVVDVKVPSQRKGTKGPFETLRDRTHDLWKALRRESKAKKKRATKQKVIKEKERRNFLESLRESGVGKFAAGVTNKLTSPVAGIFETIIKALALIFTGWLMNYLPQILGVIKGFVNVVKTIVNLAKPIVLGLLAVGTWITDKGVKLIALLAGVSPDEALNNSIIKNLTEIQKRIPLIEAAFAGFLIFQGLTGIRSLGKGWPKRRTANARRLSKLNQGGSRFNASRKLSKTRSTSKAVRKRFAQRFGGKASKARFGGQITGKNVFGPQKALQSKVFGRGGSRVFTRATTKLLGKGAGKIAMRMTKLVSRYGKVPIIGPLIVGISQVLAGEPLGKALFMALGTGLGELLGGALAAALGVGTAGFGAVLAPGMLIAGGMIGTFVGELLYEGFLGKGWGAAAEKLKKKIVGIFTGTGEMLKSLWNWLRGGGLIELAKNVGGGIMSVFSMIGNALKAVGNGAQIAGKWLADGTGRFMSGYMEKHSFKLPDWALNWTIKKIPFIPDWLKNWDGRILNPLQLMNPFAMWPLLFESFFPQKAAAMAERKAAVESGDAPKKNALGIVMSDEHQSAEYLKKRDSGQLPASNNAGAISESASYDQPGGGDGGGATIMPVNIQQMQGGGGGGVPSRGGGPIRVNKYELTNDLKKSLILARLYRD